MPVIVNELEIVTDARPAADPPGQPGRASATQTPAAPPPALGPEEVAELLRQDAARAARLSDC